MEGNDKKKAQKKVISIAKKQAPIVKKQTPIVNKPPTMKMPITKNPIVMKELIKQTANIRNPKKPIGTLKLLNDNEQNKEKKVVAVIVTFCTGSTYDNLFSSVEQKSLEGTKVEVYACSATYLPQLIQAFEGKPHDAIAERLLGSIKQVQNDCVVFNWECCSGYSKQTFPQKGDVLFGFLKKMIDRGYMCMFSDFSLKALVHEWNEKYELGPNPFVKTGEYEGMFEIRFNCSELKECPSAQLQIIGDMAEQGHCNIHALGQTIIYCVDSDKINHDIYKLQVLTVVPNIKPPKASYISKIGQYQGSAGHILLKYPSGGMILASMGHWIELMKIDTSEQKLFEVAEQEFGAEEVVKMKEEYMKMDVKSQKEYVSSKAREFVRNQAPCSNMNKKSKKANF